MKARTWSLISLLLLVAAMFLWLKGNEKAARDAAHTKGGAAGAGVAASSNIVPLLTRLPAGQGGAQAGAAVAVTDPKATVGRRPASAGPLVRNTKAGIDALQRTPTAILLRNAWIDMALPQTQEIPAHLKAAGNPGGYIVQFKGSVDGFKAQARAAGADIVSYIPNNAFLVKADGGAAARLASGPYTQSMLPYEPYFKLDPNLLAYAVDRTELPDGARLGVVMFPGETEIGRSLIESFGGTILGQGKTPFGDLLVVEPRNDTLVALAASAQVQLIEPYAARVPMNDLSRVRLGVATVSTNTTNYLGLDGDGVLVNLNDTGVDVTNPDLKGAGLVNSNRVFGDRAISITDTNGHGTHVAGVIGSSGDNGPVGTNVQQSVEGARFQGMAPKVSIFSIALDAVDPVFLSTGGSTNGTGATNTVVITDSYLQDVAARTNYVTMQRTNVLISNNSWGYPAQFDYTAAAATYDAAARDALPDVAGSQGVLYVFAAGNNGGGNGAGQGGEPGSITAPATAKNVITVGAIDNLRMFQYDVVTTNTLTNTVGSQTVVTNVLVTNKVDLAETDSSDEVTPFSGRGNVGIGQEGQYGRFKPDVVAPGAFVVSTRATGWKVNANPTNRQVTVYSDQTLGAHQISSYSMLIPANATNVVLETLPNSHSPSPFPSLPIYVKFNDYAVPDSSDLAGYNLVITNKLSQGYLFYAISNATSTDVRFDLRAMLTTLVTLDTNYFKILTNADQTLNSPYYRYESGTSVAAGAVSGMLALVQQYCASNNIPDSPALLKALLINGSRSLGPQYNFLSRNLINYQGWGLPNLPSVLQPLLNMPTNSTDLDWAVVNQSPTNSLATGQTHEYELKLPEDATLDDLKVTLVWTDPPGNPVSSTKLVNDLDVVVSNVVSGVVYAGNDIVGNSDYTRAATTNEPPIYDAVNNVENVMIRGPLDTNYVIRVIGRRVNVNAVTANTNNIAQDYALVVSVSSTNRVQLSITNLYTVNQAESIGVTNGLPLLKQRVGANSPLVGGAYGATNQWKFYVFTNSPQYSVEGITNGQYVAFITFSPPNLSAPRNFEADIDMYVSRGDAGMLSLDPNTLGGAFTSRTRGGTELVSFTNSFIGEVFYVGVKSEDQMAAEYGFIGLSSNIPFDESDPYGNRTLRAFPVRAEIPDGSPVDPGAALVFAVGINPAAVGKVVVTNILRHNLIGDLVGNLSHNGVFTVLNNHTLNSTPVNDLHFLAYDDAIMLNSAFRHTDGPGSLRDFLGSEIVGPWILTMVDNALGHTGRVEWLQLHVEPNPDLLAGAAFTLLAGEMKDYFIDVPVDASRLTVIVSSLTGPIQVFLRHGAPPTLSTYDKMAGLQPPGGEVSLSIIDSPPLVPGRFYISLYNPGLGAVSGFVRVRIERNLSDEFRKTFVSTNQMTVVDDATIIGTNRVTDARSVSSVKVGVRIEHPRVSDLSLTLVSPQGNRVLLNENRGLSTRSQLGFDGVFTNFHHVAMTYDTNSGLAALYFDGEQVIERKVGTHRLQTTGKFYLGYRPSTNGPAAQYLGQMDEVDVYQRALTAPEIHSIYKFGGASKPPREMVVRWPFDGTPTDALTNIDAVLTGTIYEAAKFDRGLTFYGGDHVTAPNVLADPVNLDVGAHSGVTVDMWINPRDLSEDRPLALWSDGINKTGLEFLIRRGTLTNIAPGELMARLVDINGVTNDVVAPQAGNIITNGLATNTVYAVFTDDTNLTQIPIKFADPAVGVVPSLTNRVISGFEDVVGGPVVSFLKDDRIEGSTGWLVTSNKVAVLEVDQPLRTELNGMVHTGRRVLALGTGAVERVFATVPGKTYRIQATHRAQPLFTNMVAWWRGDDDALNAAGTNYNGVVSGSMLYAPAMVGRGFLFTNNNAILSVLDKPGLNLTNGVTIEMWAMADPVGTYGGGLLMKGLAGGGYNYGFSLGDKGLDLFYNDPLVVDPLTQSPGSTLEVIRRAPAPTAGVFHHLAGTLSQISTNQVRLRVYVDGAVVNSLVLQGALTNTLTSAPLLIGSVAGGSASFNGILDEVALYNSEMSDEDIESIYEANALGKCPAPFLPTTRMTVGNSASSFVSESQWATNSMTFLASGNTAKIELRAVERGALIDSVEIEELAATYFEPEEPLKPLLGESALGTWRLEIVDRRVGGNTNAATSVLLGWELDFTFAPPVVPTVLLTNGVAYTNTIPSGAVRYFMADVPLNVSRATNTFTGASPLDLYFNQNGLPLVAGSTGTVQLLSAATNSIVVIGTNGTWLARTNGAIIGSVSSVPTLIPGQRYQLAITNTGGTAVDYGLKVDFDRPDLVYTVLTNTQTYSTNITVTNTLQYYLYKVSGFGQSLTVDVTPADGDVNLYLRKALDVPDPLPGPLTFDYAAETAGTVKETIKITRGSNPVPLSSGDWYIGVANVATNKVNYTIKVTELTAPTVQYVLLSAGSPVTAIVSPNAITAKIFVFTARNSPPAVQFDVDSATSPLDLLVGHAVVPLIDSYTAFDHATPTAPARVVVRQGAFPDLTGDWYLLVTNLTTTTTFRIMASLPPATPGVTTLQNNIPKTNTVSSGFEIDYYKYTVAPAATNVMFAVQPFNGNVDLLLKKDLPLPDYFTFDFLSQNPGEDRITLSAGDPVYPISSGDWYIGVMNSDSLSVTYRVFTVELLSAGGLSVRLTPSFSPVQGAVSFSWETTPGLSFEVEYATSIPAVWQPAGAPVTSSTGSYQFIEDPAQTGGATQFKMFRLRLLEVMP